MQQDQEFSFKGLFVPLTTLKAIHWIIFIGLIVYVNSLFGQFLLDDQSQIVSNTFVHTILNIPAFFTGGTFFYFTSNASAHLVSQYYRPLQTSTFAIIYTFFGTNTFFYHFIQTSLHISNAILLFYFLKRIFNKNISLLLSLIFLVHPIQVESVVYISAMQEELFMLFGMIALLLVSKNKSTTYHAVLIPLFLLLSLLSKETGILFVFVTLLYKLLFYRKNLIRYAIFSILLTGSYLFLYFFVAKIHFTPLPEVPIEVAPLTIRLITMPAVIFFYLSTFFFPLHLITGQIWLITSFNFWQYYFPFVIDCLFFIILLLVGIVFWKLNKKLFFYYVFFFFWFCMGLGLHLQLISLDFTVADRWFYFPIIGILGMLGVVFQIVIQKYDRAKVAIYTAMITICILLSLRTIIRNTNWNSDLALVSHDIIYLHNNAYMESELATDLQTSGDYKGAVAHYKKSYSIYPAPAIVYDLGATYQTMQKYDNAAAYYQRFLNIQQTDFGYVSLGFSLLKEQTATQSAIILLNKATKLYPSNDKLWLLLAIANYDAGNSQLALQQAYKAKSLYSSIENTTVLYRIQHNLSIILQ